MWNVPVLAHGALGIWDEVIFISIGVIFLVVMGAAWLKTRALPPELDEPTAPSAAHDVASTPDRFRLD